MQRTSICKSSEVNMNAGFRLNRSSKEKQPVCSCHLGMILSFMSVSSNQRGLSGHEQFTDPKPS